MKRKQLARELAREQGTPTGQAQDEIDALVQEILHKLRTGQPVELPGLGKLMPGGDYGGAKSRGRARRAASRSGTSRGAAGSK